VPTSVPDGAGEGGAVDVGVSITSSVGVIVAEGVWVGEGWGVASLGRCFGVEVAVGGGDRVSVGLGGDVAVAVGDGSVVGVGERVKVGVAGEARKKPFRLIPFLASFTAFSFTEARIFGPRA